VSSQGHGKDYSRLNLLWSCMLQTIRKRTKTDVEGVELRNCGRQTGQKHIRTSHGACQLSDGNPLFGGKGGGSLRKTEVGNGLRRRGGGGGGTSGSRRFTRGKAIRNTRHCGGQGGGGGGLVVWRGLPSVLSTGGAWVMKRRSELQKEQNLLDRNQKLNCRKSGFGNAHRRG